VFRAAFPTQVLNNSISVKSLSDQKFYAESLELGKARVNHVHEEGDEQDSGCVCGDDRVACH